MKRPAFQFMRRNLTFSDKLLYSNLGLRVTAVMRGDIPLFVLCVLGAYAVHKVSGECSTSNVQLQYNQIGQSFFPYADGYDLPIKGYKALKGSPDKEYIFWNRDVEAFGIFFTQGVEVDSLQFEIKLSTSVRVKAFQTGSSVEVYDKNVTTGGDGWELKNKIFDIGLPNIKRMSITWTSNSTDTGLRKMVVNACKAAPCVVDKIVKTNFDLNQPSGFTITIPGPALSGQGNTNPVAVLRGSESEVALSISNWGDNFIRIISASAFKLRDISIEVKNGIGIYVEAFSDPSRRYSRIFFKQRVTSDDSDWVSLGLGSVLGQALNLRRIELKILVNNKSYEVQTVFARNLQMNTCK